MGISTESAQFTAEQAELWATYSETLASLNLHLDRCLKEEVKLKLTDYKILEALVDSSQKLGLGADNPPLDPAVVRMRDLAQITAVSPSRLTYQVNSLCQQGLVRKIPIPADRRGKGVAITNQGWKVYKKAQPVYLREVHHLALAHFKPETERALYTFCLTVQSRLNAL